MTHERTLPVAWSKSGAVVQSIVWCRLWLVLVFAVGGLAPGVRASADESGRVKQVYNLGGFGSQYDIKGICDLAKMVFE